MGASVLIPVLNEEAHVERSLEAILAQRFERSLEILVVDGGSEDRTVPLVEGLARDEPRIRLLRNPSRHIPHALNIGLRQARGQYVVRMDAHARYPPDYIARGVARLEAGGVECVSGPPIPEGVNSWSRRVVLALGTHLGVGEGVFRQPREEVEVDTTFTGVWRRTTLVGVGGWDEAWLVNEDSELCARITEAGGRSICIPAMAAHYVPRQSLGALARQYWRYGQFRAKTARRHPTGLRRTHLLPPAVTATIVGAAVAPGPVRRLVRKALPLYAGALAVGTAEAATADGARPADVAWLPVVFATMHLSWGAGFLLGCVRFGPPLAAVSRAFGIARDQPALAPTTQDPKRRP